MIHKQQLQHLIYKIRGETLIILVTLMLIAAIWYSYNKSMTSIDAKFQESFGSRSHSDQ